MGRACKDDLPDSESEIFLQKGLGKSLSSGATVQVLRAMAKSANARNSTNGTYC
jgi:hypothetical protein